MAQFRIIVSPREIPQHETIVEGADQDAALISAIAAFGTTQTHKIVSCEELPAEAVAVPPIEG